MLRPIPRSNAQWRSLMCTGSSAAIHFNIMVVHLYLDTPVIHDRDEDSNIAPEAIHLAIVRGEKVGVDVVRERRIAVSGIREAGNAVEALEESIPIATVFLICSLRDCIAMAINEDGRLVVVPARLLLMLYRSSCLAVAKANGLGAWRCSPVCRI